jgi:hypothetical protein
LNGDIGGSTLKWNQIWASSLIAGNGNVDGPGFRFGGDTDTGLFLGGLGILSVTAGGSTMLQIDNGSSVTVIAPLHPGADVTYNLGASTLQWNQIWASAIHTTRLVGASTEGWDITASGHLVPTTGSAQDIGTSAIPIRDLYMAGSTLWVNNIRVIFASSGVIHGNFDAMSGSAGGGGEGAAMPSGAVADWPTSTPPSGWLECDGAAVSMTTYEDLFDVILDDYGKDAGNIFTVDTGDDTVEDVAHGLSDNDIVWLTTTVADLPAGLSIDTKYYVINKTDDDYQVSLTLGGIAVVITDAGTGDHSWHSTFNIPDYRGEFRRGWDNTAGNDPDAGSRTDRGDGTTGDNVGTKQDHEFESHTHDFGSGTTGGIFVPVAGAYVSRATGARGGNETRPRNVNVMPIIKI